MESLALCSTCSSSSLISYTRFTSSLSNRTKSLSVLTKPQPPPPVPSSTLSSSSSPTTHTFGFNIPHYYYYSSSLFSPKPPFHQYNSHHPIPSSSSSSSSSSTPPLEENNSSSTATTSPPHQGRQGAKLIPLAISLSIGLAIRFLVPKPVQVSTQAWQLLAIFLSTNIGLILNPLPIGAWAFLSLTASIFTKTLTFSNAFKGFQSEVIWMVAISFFFSRGVVKTGLGNRFGTYFVKWFGKSALSLSYGLVAAEMFVAPTMPGAIARAGGVFLPIIKSTVSISDDHASTADPSTTNKKLGAYLIQSQLQSVGSSSALFLTGSGCNFLCLKLAEELGVKIARPWVTWFKAASLPAFVSLLATPYILYKIFPPETEETLDATAIATLKLEQMGPVTKNEWVMMSTMLLAVSLWIFGEAIGVSSVAVAMLGLSVLLLLGVLSWEDCLRDKSAWDTLTWFAILVGMASQLTNLGIVTWMSNCVAKFLESFSLTGLAAFGVLHAAYFFAHYIFASQAAHVGALYSSFLAMHMASGVPGVLAALSLAYNTCLFGALTHYSSAQAAAYYGAGYVDVADCFRLGIIMAIVNVVIWGGLGTLWWKYLGLF